MPHASGTSGYPGSKRRSQRVLMQVEIQVRGIDTQGKKFEEETHTLAISAHGGLILLHNRLSIGSIVTLRNCRTEEERQTRVAYLGLVCEGNTETGLEFTEPQPFFWRIAFPPEDWNRRNAEARTASHPRANDG